MNANSVVAVREVSGYWPEIIGALITGIFILLAAIIGAKYGLRTYFRKREHELILKRYLDEGIDRLSEAVDDALRVFLTNYTEASAIVMRAKYGGKANLKKKFEKFERRYLKLTPFYKIEYLVGDNIFSDAVQLVLGFVEAWESFLNTEFRSILSKMPKEETKRRELLNGMDKQLDKYYQKSLEYHQVLSELQSIALILEKETTLTWVDLGKFKNRTEIKQSVEKLKKLCTVLNLKIQIQ